MILNPYNFIHLTAHIKFEINYSKKLKNRCIQEESLIALNDTFTIQEINLEKKSLSTDIKPKEIEAYWINEFREYSSKNHYKIFCNYYLNF